MRKPFLAGNWKMHGTKASVSVLTDELLKNSALFDAVQMVLCPSHVFLSQVHACIADTPIKLSGQNLCQHTQGAYTGEVCPEMLRDQGCDYVILGHSERRQMFREDNDLVAVKTVAAQKAGLTPIVCVGETLEQREKDLTLEVIKEQLSAVFGKDGIDVENMVIAYEPVWAIGTGKTASPEQAQEVHAAIRAMVAEVDAGFAEKLTILYGGSVKPENAQELFSKPDIDGGLIGGASLSADQFVAIAKCFKGEV